MTAYELAGELEKKDRLWNIEEQLMIDVCHMLRQQADRIAELEKQTKPLSDEEIIAIRDSCYVQSGIDEWEFDDVNFAKAIEERHGIK